MKDEIVALPHREFVSQTGRTVLGLRELLIKGAFQPGERLSEVSLAARLGVSRTPIRLALDRLANEGLIEPCPSGGFAVRSFTLDDIWDSIAMRGVLEGAAARLAAERVADPAELDRIKDLQRRMDEIANNTFESFAHYMDLNSEFHTELVRLAKSPMLERTLDHLVSLPFAGAGAGVYARAKPHHDLAVIGWQQHHALLDAIEHRQGTRAEAIAREHANLARRHLEVVVEGGQLSDFLKGSALVRMEKNTQDGVTGQAKESPGGAN